MPSQQGGNHLKIEWSRDVAVVVFIDRNILDEQSIQLIGEQLFSLVDQENVKKLLLSFRNVEYLSSAALGKLIPFNKKVKAAGGKLILCNIKPQIDEVFKITRLDKLVKIMKDEQEALKAFD